MKRSPRNLALCATALTCFANPAFASTLDISGIRLTEAPGSFYDSSLSSHNVVNSAGAPATGSVLTDGTEPTLASDSPWRMNGSVTTSASNYTVNWFYAGSESGNAITFDAAGLSGGTGAFTETNSNCGLGCGTTGPIFMGMTENSLAFSLRWNGLEVGNNGIPNATPDTGSPSLVYSYLLPNASAPGFSLTNNSTDWFAFALNDNGGDVDHDDFVGFAQLMSTPPGAISQNPIPAALSLFGSVLAGGLVFGIWRRRQKLRRRRRY